VDTELSLKILCEFTGDGISPIKRSKWQGFSCNARTIKKRIIKESTVSVVIYWIMVSNSNEEALSGEKENAMMANTDTNTGSSFSELAYPLD
jgi:hypothetical protein